MVVAARVRDVGFRGSAWRKGLFVGQWWAIAVVVVGLGVLVVVGQFHRRRRARWSVTSQTLERLRVAGVHEDGDGGVGSTRREAG
jgi:hypothetical protein